MSGTRPFTHSGLLLGVGLALGGCYLSHAGYLEPDAEGRPDGADDAGAGGDAEADSLGDGGLDDGSGADGAGAAETDDAVDTDDAGPPPTCATIPDALVVPDDLATIQAAIDTASDGRVVCVEPGLYHERLDFLGKRIRVVGVAGPEATILEPDEEGSAVSFVGGEAAETVFEGFTVRGGVAVDDVSTPVSETEGGGILVRDSSPTLRDLIVTGNRAEEHGGGLNLSDSAATLVHVQVLGNEAGGNGGGLAIRRGAPTLTDVRLAGNRAGYTGGGIEVLDATTLTLTHVQLVGNEGSYEAGALYSNRSVCRLANVLVAGNRAGNAGGGLTFTGAPAFLDHVRIVGNVGGEAGITLVNDADGSRLTNVVIAGNRAGRGAGGLWVSASEVSLENVTIVGNVNEGDPGGGIGVDALGFLTMTNVVMAGNRGVGGRAICSASPRDPAISYSAFWNHGTWPFEGLDNPIGVDGNFTADPLFIDSSAEDPADWDLHLAPESPLLHTGNPARTDADGSQSSIGAYGGPAGDAWDLEGDGVPDE